MKRSLISKKYGHHVIFKNHYYEKFENPPPDTSSEALNEALQLCNDEFFHRTPVQKVMKSSLTVKLVKCIYLFTQSSYSQTKLIFVISTSRSIEPSINMIWSQ